LVFRPVFVAAIIERKSPILFVDSHSYRNSVCEGLSFSQGFSPPGQKPGLNESKSPMQWNVVCFELVVEESAFIRRISGFAGKEQTQWNTWELTSSSMVLWQ
jgi:hypothetical protein